MSTVYPKHKIENGSPLDPDRLNDNYREIIQEVNGNLNETNIKRGSLTSEKNFVEGALCRTHKNFEVGKLNCFDSTIGPAYAPVSAPIEEMTYKRGLLPRPVRFPFVKGSEKPTPLDGNVIVPLTNEWISVCTLDVTTREGLIWVLGSLQQTYYVDGGEYSPGGSGSQASSSKEETLETPGRYRFFPGVQYCIALDGARVAETTIGGQEISNDKYGASYGVWSHPFVTDLVFPISAGKHVIELKARVPKANRSYPAFDPNHSSYVVSSRELIALELT
tara:strand:+ start:2047 stop:2877 length:831 start_codon:yes stop_codon:yes gene_type:complete